MRFTTHLVNKLVDDVPEPGIGESELNRLLAGEDLREQVLK